MDQPKRESTPTGPSSPRRGERSPRSPREISPRHQSSRSPRRQSSPREDRKREEGTLNKGATLCVTGLSSRTRESDLDRAFAKAGKVLNTKLITDPRTQESRGFAFIVMESVEQAEEAIYTLDRTELDGRVISVEKVFLAFLRVIVLVLDCKY